MISFLSNWVKNIGLAIVIVSILEMILPNNKTKKYIKTIMGIYVIFCMISPFIKNKIDISSANIESYIETASETQEDKTSMDRKIKQLYIEELEKNISKKVESKGYKVKKCKVDATITDKVDSTKIDKITLQVEVDENKQTEVKEDVEDRIVSEVQKIKEVNTTIVNNEKTEEDNKKTNLTQTQKKELKKFLKEEYEVNEKCLIIT